MGRKGEAKEGSKKKMSRIEEKRGGVKRERRNNINAEKFLGRGGLKKESRNNRRPKRD